MRRPDGWHFLRRVHDGRSLHDEVAEFRRIPNLFEIMSYDYWHDNYGYQLPEAAQAHKEAYLATAAGREHVLALVRTPAGRRGHRRSEARGPSARTSSWRRRRLGFFGGGHDVIVGRRHVVDGATHVDQLASSGTLTPEEHYQYTRFTVGALREMYLANRYARYVAVFQNWLKPAGASFDHLHKQLVAIDDRGVQAELELQRLRVNPNLYNEVAVNYAGYHNLVVAENDHAIAFAGFGHRYPSLEIYSKSAHCQPWEHLRRAARHVRPDPRLPRGDRARRAVQRGMAPQAAGRRRADAVAGGAEVAGLDPGRVRGRYQDLPQHDSTRGPCVTGWWPGCSGAARRRA